MIAGQIYRPLHGVKVFPSVHYIVAKLEPSSVYPAYISHLYIQDRFLCNRLIKTKVDNNVKLHIKTITTELGRLTFAVIV